MQTEVFGENATQEDNTNGNNESQPKAGVILT